MFGRLMLFFAAQVLWVLACSFSSGSIAVADPCLECLRGRYETCMRLCADEPVKSFYECRSACARKGCSSKCDAASAEQVEIERNRLTKKRDEEKKKKLLVKKKKPTQP